MYHMEQFASHGRARPRAWQRAGSSGSIASGKHHDPPAPAARLPRFPSAGTSPTLLRSTTSYCLAPGLTIAAVQAAARATRQQEAGGQGGGGRGDGSGGAGRRLEIPIKFLSESGLVRASELTHRVSKAVKAPGAAREDQPAPRTLQPSKHGFHRRSKSPTFKVLVAAADRLQTLSAPQDSAPAGPAPDPHCPLCVATTPTDSAGHEGSLRFPTMSGVFGSDMEEDYKVKRYHSVSNGVASSSPAASRLCPQHRTKLEPGPTTPAKGGGAVRVTPGAKARVQRRESQSWRAAKPLTTSAAHTPKVSSASSSSAHNDGWGAWEVESEASGVTLPLALAADLPPALTDNHTELHLFLPRLADTPRSDLTTARCPDVDAQAEARPHRGRAGAGAGGGGRKGALNGEGHPNTPHRPNLTHAPPPHITPQSHAHSGGGGDGAGERHGRAQSKRFTSPVRPGKRDRTPSKRRPPIEVYESYEPYIRGEHLKEKLDDFPTLISLDHD